MTEEELTRLCAEAMGLTTIEAFGHPHVKHDHWPSRDTSCEKTGIGLKAYSPIDDDAQAMALVKKFGLNIEHRYWDDPLVYKDDAHFNRVAEATAPDLNRAICECVAKMQKARKK